MPTPHRFRWLSLLPLAALLFGALPAALFAPAALPAEEAGEIDLLGDFPGIDPRHDWPWWRGPGRNGLGAAGAPARLDPARNLRWRAEIPGRGHSSPIVVGDRVFLTTAEEAEQRHWVLAYDRRTGERLWSTEVNQGGFPTKNHRKNTEASPTPACDGERVIGVFHHRDQVHAVALDLEGKLLWNKSLGEFRPRRNEYGYAPSPLLYRDLVIVAAEFDGASFLAALRRTDGSEAWRMERPRAISFSSPVVARAAGREQLLLCGAKQITSYDPATGRELWSAEGAASATSGTVVWDGDLVFASGGFPESETVAVRADGSGEVVWRHPRRCYEQSLLAHEGYVYAFTDPGVFYCWRAADGAEMWVERLRGPVSASPVLAGGRIYWANELGTLYVLRPNPERFELLAENQLGDDAFPSPAVSRGELFLRVGHAGEAGRRERLYCFGE